MSENQHKCKLTGVELQQVFLDTLKFRWKYDQQDINKIRVDIGNPLTHYNYVSFSEFEAFSKIYWEIVKKYPIDVIHYNIDNSKTFDVVLYNEHNIPVESWNYVAKEQLEETILQAVVTYHNINKHKEEQT